MSLPQKNKSRRTLLLALGVFVLPVVLAKLALEQHWFNYGVTNQGELSTQELTLTDLDLTHEGFKEQWLLLYRIPEGCDELCQKTLLAVNNSYTLLGKELPRVTPVALFENPLTDKEQANFRHHKWLQIAISMSGREKLLEKELVVVDPLGNVVMVYKSPNDEAGLNHFSKAILADMKKLLKYSRIG